MGRNQAIATCLFADRKAPVKRSQHFNVTLYWGATYCMRLATLSWRVVAWCCSRLVRFGQQCCAWACALFRFSARNMSQHVSTGWPNACNMLRPTMLPSVALKYCDRFAGACKCWANNVGICRVEMLKVDSDFDPRSLRISCWKSNLSLKIIGYVTFSTQNVPYLSLRSLLKKLI